MFLLGADPELFLVGPDGNICNAHNIIPGTKMNPSLVPCGAIQVDGMALELNINPCRYKSTWTDRIYSVRRSLEKRLPAGYSTSTKSFHYFPFDYMHKQPKKSLELGCDPDFNAYTGLPNPQPIATNLRTAAGHVHLGWTDKEVVDDWFFQLCCNFTKVLDLTVGLYCFFLDNDVERKKLYGKAGSFRPKPYGLEYRTPSNAWLRSKKSIQNVYVLSSLAYFWYKNQGVIDYFERKVDASSERVRNIINNKNTDEETIARIKDEFFYSYGGHLHV